MPQVLDDPTQHLLSRLELRQPRWIVGMGGLPGSGKSTLASRLAEEVNASAGAPIMMALGMDGFHLTKAQLRQMPAPDAAFARRGAPWTFDPAALTQRLQMLREGAGRIAVDWPGFQHDVGDPVQAAHAVAPITRLVLVEGLYLLHEADGWAEVGGCFDERWFLDTPLQVALERLTARHMEAWNMTRAEAEARIASNDGLNAQIVAATRQRADWLVAG